MLGHRSVLPLGEIRYILRCAVDAVQTAGGRFKPKRDKEIPLVGDAANRGGAGSEFVTVERTEGGIAVLRLQRPDRRNALNLQLKQELQQSLQALHEDVATQAVIITGGDEFFVGGSDVAEMRDLTPHSHRALETGKLFEQLRAFEKLTIAAVEGYALGGGCELALACDMVVASRSARFGQPEIRVGIMPGAGGIQMLLRGAGSHRAARLLLTGDPFSAEEAFAFGLVSELAEPGGTLRAAEALARKVLAMPPLAVKAIKEAIRHGQDAPLTAALAYERRLFELLFASQDQVEGMQAFLDRRPARFTGH